MGTPLWTLNGVAICTTVNDQYNPTIVSDGSGGAIITWNDFRNGSDYDIYAQKIDENGSIIEFVSVPIKIWELFP